MPRPDTWQAFQAVGALEKEPEIRSTSGGTTVANLSLSTESSYKDKSGTWQTKKEWHKVVVFGQQAQQFAGIAVGSLIFVSGLVETRSYESEGSKRYITEIKADRVALLSGKRTESSEPRTAAGQQTRQAPPSQTRATTPFPRAEATDSFSDGTGITNDDLPDNFF